MTDNLSIFKFKRPNADKLKAFGFTEAKNVLTYRRPINDGQFYVTLTVHDGEIGYIVTDAADGGEYALVKVPWAHGAFLAQIRGECEKLLKEVAEKCFDMDAFKAEQTRRVLKYIENTYSVKPEYLWEKSPDSAALRHRKNQKWFAVIMSVDKSKLNPDFHGQVEIMDLKATADWVEGAVDGLRYYKGYHMNKKYWYTVSLDGTLEDEEIFKRIDESFCLTE